MILLPAKSVLRYQRYLVVFIVITSIITCLLGQQAIILPMLLGLFALVTSFLAPTLSMVLLAIIAPFEQAREVSYLGTIYTTEYLLVVIMPGWIWQLLNNRAWRRPLTPVLMWSLPFLILISCHLLFQPSSFLAKGIIRWLEFFVVLILGNHIIRRPAEAHWCWWALVIAATVNAGLGIIQTWQGTQVWPHLLSYTTTWGEVVRATGFYGPNTLASLTVLVVPFMLVNSLIRQHPIKKIVSLFMLATLVIGLLATFSVIGYGAILVALTVLVIFLKPKLIKPVFYSILGLFILSVIGLVLYPEIILSTALHTKLLSFQDRLRYVQIVGAMLQGYPYLGIGTGLYKFLAIDWQVMNTNIIGLITHPHSLVLLILIENGVLGLATFIWGLGKVGLYMIKKIMCIVKKATIFSLNDRLAFAAVAGLIGVGVINIGEHGLVHDRGIHIAIAITTTLVMLTKNRQTTRRVFRQQFDKVWDQEPKSIDWMQMIKERSEGRRVLYQVVDEALKNSRNAKILELGCGPALDAIRLAKDPNYEVHGLDGSTSALRLAAQACQALGLPVTLHHADVRCTNIASATFDLIYSQGLLEHFQDPEPVWKEMHRLLKPNGNLIVDVPQTMNSYTLTKWFHQFKGTWPWGWETQYSVSEMKKMGKKVGFNLIASRGYGYHRGRLDVIYFIKKWSEQYWPKLWTWLENNGGQFWMMNLVACFELKERQK